MEVELQLVATYVDLPEPLRIGLAEFALQRLSQPTLVLLVHR